MQEWGVTWREFESWTPSQLMMFADRALQRREREQDAYDEARGESGRTRRPVSILDFAAQHGSHGGRYPNLASDKAKAN